MDLILIAALTVALLVVVIGYGVNSLLQIKGVTVFPLLRVSGKRDPLETASRLSQKPDVVHPGFKGRVASPEKGGAEMITIDQLMTKGPLKIHSEESVRTAAVMMAQNHVGSLLVEDGWGTVQGIVTETDIVRKVTACDIPPLEKKVTQIMSSPVITIDRTRPVTDADKLMGHHHTRHLAVTESGRIIGVLSVRDLLHPIYEEKGA